MTNNPQFAESIVGRDRITTGNLTDSVLVIGEGAQVTVNTYTGAPPVIAAAAPSVPRHLRAPAADFVGREQELAELTAVLQAGAADAAHIVGLFGMGGMGKTETALLLAQHLATSYPDGQVLLALDGTSRSPRLAAQALRLALRALAPELPALDDLEALRAEYRTRLSGKRVLVLADNASGAAQVEPLLPPLGSALLITSRQRFSLPGMRQLVLKPLPPEQAEGLLLAIAPRIGQFAGQVARCCGYLPLALRIAAGLLANDETRDVATYLEALCNQREALTATRDPDNPEADVERSFALSYDGLELAAQQVFCQCAVFAGSFDLAAARAVLVPEAGAAPPAQLEALLGQLFRRSLVEFDSAQRRYALPNLLRAFAATRLAGEDLAVWLRYAHYYLGLAQAAEAEYQAGGAQQQAGLARFDREQAHIDAAWGWLREQAPTPETDELLLGFGRATLRLGELRYDLERERIPQLEAVLAAVRRLGKRELEGRVRNNLGIALAAAGDLARARLLYDEALPIARELGDRDAEANALGSLATLAARQGQVAEALAGYTEALAIKQASGDGRGEAALRSNLGLACYLAGEVLPAIEQFEAALRIRQSLADSRGEAMALVNLGLARQRFGALARAGEAFAQALERARLLRDKALEGVALGNLANVHALRGERELARTCYEQALTLKRARGDREGEALTGWDFAQLLLDEGEHARAVELMQRCVEYERAIGHPSAAADAAELERARARAGE